MVLPRKPFTQVRCVEEVTSHAAQHDAFERVFRPLLLLGVQKQYRHTGLHPSMAHKHYAGTSISNTEFSPGSGEVEFMDPPRCLQMVKCLLCALLTSFAVCERQEGRDLRTRAGA